VRKIQEAASLPFARKGRKQHVSLSPCASTFRGTGRLRGAAAQRRCRDAAVKDAGGNGFPVLRGRHDARRTEPVELENALRVAPERGDSGLALPAQVEIASGRISGLER